MPVETRAHPSGLMGCGEGRRAISAYRVSAHHAEAYGRRALCPALHPPATPRPRLSAYTFCRSRLTVMSRASRFAAHLAHMRGPATG